MLKLLHQIYDITLSLKEKKISRSVFLYRLEYIIYLFKDNKCRRRFFYFASCDKSLSLAKLFLLNTIKNLTKSLRKNEYIKSMLSM